MAGSSVDRSSGAECWNVLPHEIQQRLFSDDGQCHVGANEMQIASNIQNTLPRQYSEAYVKGHVDTFADRAGEEKAANKVVPSSGIRHRMGTPDSAYRQLKTFASTTLAFCRVLWGQPRVRNRHSRMNGSNGIIGNIRDPDEKEITVGL